MEPTTRNAIWYASDLKSHTGKNRFSLLSMHRHAINLQVDEWKHLLIIGDSVLEKGPATVAFSNTDFVFLKKCIESNAQGLFDKTCLTFEPVNEMIQFTWLESQSESFYPVRYGCSDRSLIKKSLTAYRKMIEKFSPQTASAVLLGLKGGDRFFRQEIAANFPLLVRAILQKKIDSFIAHSQNISGMGRGMTPTGDDLIHGALIACHYFNYDHIFMNKCKSMMDLISVKTNIFGRHMLEIALNGLTPQPYILFLQSIALGEPKEEIIKTVKEIGSGSGYEIAIAIIIYLEEACNEKSYLCS